jgi:hypothetical protein
VVRILGGSSYDEFLTWDSNTLDGRNRVGIGFDSKGVLHAMAMRDGEVFRLELELKAK